MSTVKGAAAVLPVALAAAFAGQSYVAARLAPYVPPHPVIPARRLVRPEDLCPPSWNNIPWAATAINFILKSNIAAEYLGVWSKKRELIEHVENIRKVGPEKFDKLFSNIAGTRRMQTYDRRPAIFKKIASLIDPDANSCPRISEDTLARELHTLVYSTKSPLVQGFNDSANSKATEEAALFSNSERWYPTGATPARPKVKEIAAFLDYKEVILLNAINALVPAEDRGGRVPNTMHDRITEKLLEYRGRMPTNTNLLGVPAIRYIDEAIEYVRQKKEEGTTDYITALFSFKDVLKPGTHIAYQFSGGFMHHALYMGDGVVIEVLNVDIPNSRTRVQAFITVNQLDHFIARVMSNTSELIVHEYEDRFPLAIIKRRAGWALGNFPNYHITRENCESFVSWVMTNNYTPSACMLRRNVSLRRLSAQTRAAEEELVVPIVTAPSGLENVDGGGRKRTTRRRRQ